MFKLRDYQERISDEAVEIILQYNIVYLAMEPRCGKTTTAFRIAEKIGSRVVLFCTKKKAISSISDDFDMMGCGFIIDIINYEQLGNVVRTDYDLIVVDESHSCGAFPTPSERAKRLKKICLGKKIIFLSATPSPEGYSQFYHQFWISSFSPFLQWPTFYKWANEFVTLKKKYFNNIQINDYSQANKEKIDQYTKHLFLSYSQEEAGFEQLVDEEIITIRMQPSTYVLAKKLTRDRVYIGRNNEELLADTNVKLMNKLHQIYSGTVILDSPQESIVTDYTKATYIRDHFRGQKIAIFYKFRAEAHMLYYTFPEMITENPDEFNQSDNKIFISQIQSGREGINLSTADSLIMLNLDYSAVSYWQARARLQIKGRIKEAKVYWLFSEGGIEHKIYQAVMNKRDYTLRHFIKDFNIKKDAGVRDKEKMQDTT